MKPAEQNLKPTVIGGSTTTSGGRDRQLNQTRCVSAVGMLFAHSYVHFDLQGCPHMIAAHFPSCDKQPPPSSSLTWACSSRQELPFNVPVAINHREKKRTRALQTGATRSARQPQRIVASSGYVNVHVDALREHLKGVLHHQRSVWTCAM